MTFTVNRKVAIAAGLILLVVVAYAIGARAPQTGAEASPTSIPTVEATATPKPTPRPTPTPAPEPTPQAGTPYTVYLGHIIGTTGALTEALTALGNGSSSDFAGMAATAGAVADIADAELIWLATVDPQPCYGQEFEAYRAMMDATSVAYRAGQVSISALDVDGINAATVLMDRATALIDAATAAMDTSTC